MKVGDLVKISPEWKGSGGMLGIIMQLEPDSYLRFKGACKVHVRLRSGKMIYILIPTYKQYIKVISEGG